MTCLSASPNVRVYLRYMPPSTTYLAALYRTQCLTVLQWDQSRLPGKMYVWHQHCARKSHAPNGKRTSRNDKSERRRRCLNTNTLVASSMRG